VATIALTAVGNYIGGPVGGYIGGFIGAYIDANYLLPAIFPPEDIQGPRVDSIQISAASEGAPIPWFLGKVKVGCSYIWVDNLQRISDETEVGGCGGGQKVEMTTLKLDIAVMVGDTEVTANTTEGGLDTTQGINGFLRIWADGNLIWSADPTDTQVRLLDTGGLLEIVKRVYTYQCGSNDDGSAVFCMRTYMRIQNVGNAGAGPNLSLLRPGVDCEIIGGTGGSAFNEGTFRVLWTDIEDGTLDTFFEVENDAVVPFAAGATNLEIEQDLPLAEPFTFDLIRLHEGTKSQTVDPLIDATENPFNNTGPLGGGIVPAYKNFAYFVMQGLDTGPYGRLPTSWEAQVQTDSGEFITLQDVFRRVARRARPNLVEGTDFNVDALSGINLRGIVFRQPTRISEMIQQLMIAYDLVEQDRNGVIHFYPRTQQDIVSVETGDLAAHPFGEDAPRIFEAEPIETDDLPSAVAVTYTDIDNDYQNGSQNYRRHGAFRERTVQMRLDVVMNGVEAQTIARRVMWESLGNRKKMRVQLPPSYEDAIENDSISFTDTLGEPKRMLMHRIDRGRSDIMFADGVTEDAATLEHAESDSQADPPNIPKQSLYVPPELRLIMLDIPSMRDDLATRLGFIWGVSPYTRFVFFSGARLFRSDTDAGDSFANVGFAFNVSILGETETAFSDVNDSAAWDRGNVIRVRLNTNLTLSSATEAAVLEGANLCAIGNEIMAFANATLVTPGLYEISMLRRGLFSTGNLVNTHVIGDQFMLLTPSTVGILSTGVNYLDLQLSDVNSVRDYRAVPRGGDPADYQAQYDDLRFHGFSTLPWPVVQPKLTVNQPAGSVLIEWNRRSRQPVRLFNGETAPLLETEDYILEIITPGPTIARTFTTSSSPAITVTGDGGSLLYSMADYVTDYGGFPAAITFRITQLSDVRGRGRVVEFTQVPDRST